MKNTFNISQQQIDEIKAGLDWLAFYKDEYDMRLGLTKKQLNKRFNKSIEELDREFDETMQELTSTIEKLTEEELKDIIENLKKD